MIIAGTGHRPKYCPCKYDDNHPWLLTLKSDLRNFLINRIRKNDRTIIRTGMAIGWDTWLAETYLDIVDELQTTTMDLIPHTELHAYIPFEGQSSKWPYESRKKYDAILKKSDYINITSEEYHKRVFLDRDEEMITGADTVVALLHPETTTGGTFYTAKMATEKGIPVMNFWRY